MNRKGRHFISLILTICLAVAAFGMVNTCAAAEISAGKIFELKGLGILDSDSQTFDKNITRAEFCELVARLMKLDHVAASGGAGETFKDVDQSKPYANSISILVSIGLIKGYPDGTFAPDNSISYSEIIKMIVRVLGYTDQAEAKGGYPAGYIIVGTSLGLANGVVTADRDAPMTYGAALAVIYNALDVDRIVSTYTNDKASQALSSDTLRDFLMGDATEGLVKYRGVVTANYETYLLAPVSNIKKNEVQIDGMMFDKGNTNADAYLGQTVDVFIKVNERDSTYVIKEISVVAGKNTILEMPFADIDRLTADELIYRKDEGHDSATQKLTPNTLYLYNGRVCSFSDIHIDSNSNGSLKMIVSDTPDVDDIVFINEYESFVVKSIDTNGMKIFFDYDKVYRNSKSIDLSETDQITYSIVDADGKDIEFDDIQKGDVVSIFSNLNKDLVKIHVSRKEVQGTVTEVAEQDHRFVLDTVNYQIEKGLDVSTLLSEEITAKVNFENKVTYYETTRSSVKYGAIVEFSSETDIDVSGTVRMLIPDLIADTTQEVDPETETSSSTIPAIAGRNKEWKSLKLAGKVSINNKSYSKNAIKSQIENMEHANAATYLAVCYTLDANGYIKALETPEAWKLGNDRTYNAYEKTFSDGTYNSSSPTSNGAFGLTAKTLGLCIPDNGTVGVTSEDYLAGISMNDGQSYYVEAYDFNKQTKCPDLVLFKARMVYTTTGTTDANSKIALVSKVINVLNEDGQQTKKVTMLTATDGEKTYEVSDHSNASAGFDAIQSGDLIRYSLDVDNLLDGMYLLTSSKPLPAPIYYGKGSDTEIFVGNITDVEFTEVSPGLNKWVDIIKMTDAVGTEESYHILTRKSPPIFIYESNRETAKMGTHDDLLSTHKRAIVYASGLSGGVAKVKAVVIIN